jgi:hypothetical protein
MTEPILSPAARTSTDDLVSRTQALLQGELVRIRSMVNSDLPQFSPGVSIALRSRSTKSVSFACN